MYESLRCHVECVLLAGSPFAAESDGDDLNRTLSSVTKAALEKARVIIKIPKLFQLQIEAIAQFLQSFALGSRGLVVIDECHLVALWALFRNSFQHLVTWSRSCRSRKLALSGTITDAQFNAVRLADFRSWRIFAPAPISRSISASCWRAEKRSPITI